MEAEEELHQLRMNILNYCKDCHKNNIYPDIEEIAKKFNCTTDEVNNHFIWLKEHDYMADFFIEPEDGFFDKVMDYLRSHKEKHGDRVGISTLEIANDLGYEHDDITHIIQWISEQDNLDIALDIEHLRTH